MRVDRSTPEGERKGEGWRGRELEKERKGRGLEREGAGEREEGERVGEGGSWRKRGSK